MSKRGASGGRRWYLRSLAGFKLCESMHARSARSVGAARMIVRTVSLRKLLELFGAEDSLRVSLLRRDIRDSLGRQNGDDGGGDFYTPFWADAKAHVRGDRDLGAATEARIAANPRRKNLYPRLKDGFLELMSESRRLRNEPYTTLLAGPRGSFCVEGSDGEIRVHDTLHIRINGYADRIIYPYFPANPPLTSELARLGSWAMMQALDPRPVEEMRIIDIIRARSFSVRGADLTGGEGELFAARYRALCEEWYRYRAEYD